MSKTQLTPTQRQVFDQIVKLTNGGKKVYEGRVSLPGVPGSTSNHYVVLFSMLGLLKMERRPGKPRRITLLVGPEGVETTSVSAIMVARMSGRSLKEDKSPRDDGKFSEAFAAAFKGKPYPSMKMKDDVPFKGQFRPDARAV